MMNYFSNRKKWMAYLVLLTFVFTCIVPTNIVGGNSAWAEEPVIPTVQTVDENITMHLFDYTGEINGKVPLNFFNSNKSPYLSDDTNGSSTQGGHSRPVMRPYLQNGYPYVNNLAYSGDVGIGTANKNGSLQNLFTQSIGSTMYEVGKGDKKTGLFQRKDGYYTYNSTDNAAYFNQQTGQFEIYNYVERPTWVAADTTGTDNKEIDFWNALTTDGVQFTAADYRLMLNGAWRENFLPFNQGHTEGTIINTGYGVKTPAYQLTKMENGQETAKTNMWFGMTMEFDFYMPKDGQMNDQDMVFEFFGDDDVLVYIDDVLVLDISGDHYSEYGAINFATGQVIHPNNNPDSTISVTQADGSSKDESIFHSHAGWAHGENDYALYNLKGKFETVKNDENAPEELKNSINAMKWDGDTFADYTPHKLKFYYVERGGMYSYCSLKFNMPTLPPDSLTVGKEVPTTNNVLTDTLLQDEVYTFRVLESDANGNVITENDKPKVLIPEGTSYAIWQDNVDTKTTGTVGADGYFTLKAGQQAVFSNMLTYYDNGEKPHYVVREETNGGYKVSINDVENTDATTDKLATDSAQVVVFKNEPVTATLNITKEIAAGKEADFLANQEYRFEVTVDDNLLPKDTVYKIGETSKTVSEPGIVTIKANETAKIEGLLLGTEYTVRELDLTANGANPTYTVDSAVVGEAKGTIETAGQNVNVIVTNSSTQEYISVSGEKTWVEKDSETQVKHEPVTLYLFRDGVATGQTTETAVDWSYSFDNLPRYATNATVTGEEKADGHEYEYLVAEKKLDNYAPTYKTPVKDANGNVTIDITNTYGEPETETSIQVTKIWDDNNDELGKRPQSITLNLFNGVDKDPICTTTAAYDYTFTNLPIYSASGEPYVYTVTENDVDHYLSAIVPTADGFKITNTLYTGQAGQFTVNKQVEGELQPPENSEYDFNLQIKAEVVNWDAVLVSKKMELEKAHDEAYKALNGSVEDGITGATKDAQDATDDFIKNAKLTTPSAYQFVLLDGSNALFAVDRSSPSAYIWESASEVTIDPNADKGIIERVAGAIKELAQKFSNLFDKPAVFMQLLHEKVEVTTPSAVVFDKTDAVKLFNAEKARIAAEELEKSTATALQNFKTDVATPSAITIKMKADSNKLSDQTIKLDPGKDARDAEGFYSVPFTLFKGTGYTFTVEATTGANIDYKISEIQWPTENYETTNINVNGDTTLKDTRFTGLLNMVAEKANTFIFHNVYKTPEEPPYVPPTPKPDPKPEPTPTPDPDETIPDDNVPTGSVEPGEPLDELEDPEIPLGDAPATGDTNNAAPFMALLLVAIAGLVITRRKFN